MCKLSHFSAPVAKSHTLRTNYLFFATLIRPFNSLILTILAAFSCIFVRFIRPFLRPFICVFATLSAPSADTALQHPCSILRSPRTTHSHVSNKVCLCLSERTCTAASEPCKHRALQACIHLEVPVTF